jgi:hypothetical protein
LRKVAVFSWKVAVRYAWLVEDPSGPGIKNDGGEIMGDNQPADPTTSPASNSSDNGGTQPPVMGSGGQPDVMGSGDEQEVTDGGGQPDVMGSGDEPEVMGSGAEPQKPQSDGQPLAPGGTTPGTPGVKPQVMGSG